MRKAWWLWSVFGVAFVSAGAWAAEVGLVTAVSGSVTLEAEKAAATELKPFVKVREGDRLTMEASARLQVVFFESGRQETWQGAGALQVGAGSSTAVQGGLQPEVKTLPAILVKQLSKTPSPDGNVKAGMVRLRTMPSGGTLESVEKNYADLRKQAEAADRNPELYLLASYFELHEFDKVDGLLRELNEKSPGDLELKTLSALYRRAINDARTAVRK
jgi:hypothetical protein